MSKRSSRKSHRKKSRGYSERKVKNRNTRKRFLIVCEGEATEPNYFYGLRNYIDRAQVTLDIEPAGRVTLSLVQKALELKEEDGEYDRVWCVFDRDFKAENNNQQNFNEAIQLAFKNDIKLAISNDAFELWYLLHYEYYSSTTHRSDLKKMLSDKKRLGEKYKKNDEDMYEKLKDRQNQAIKNAEKLWNSYEKEVAETNRARKLTQKHNSNPSTTVHLLVKELKQYSYE
ncbi:RloB domain-containing protein [Lusitaniella coriacea LEGE 07157]|uniref:RloB domain-containing protein n=1 Tax=Lusitaniella coriacea LEGE 07157 TaxID=945747 RepID=A0A8J7DX92_9CYAN|nr:RloB family protein [Lusitaniella coriacea]MBE9116946.1 RloB domain-containing protein [Lusitaniella coriacea LEGE 07157]